MRILHYIPKNDSMITSYVDMLVNSMGLGAENIIVDAEAAAKEKLAECPLRYPAYSRLLALFRLPCP